VPERQGINPPIEGSVFASAEIKRRTLDPPLCVLAVTSLTGTSRPLSAMRPDNFDA
jgi:hypothetical protein